MEPIIRAKEEEMHAIISENEKLREINTALQEQLDDSWAHISSIQPWLRDLAPHEVGRDYDFLVYETEDWVQKLMDPLLKASARDVEEMLRQRPNEAAKLKRELQQYPDLVHGAMFPETDEDVVVAIILRFIHGNIFQKMLYDAVQSHTDVISFVEQQMKTAVEPKRDPIAVRTWAAEAYNALLCAPDFRAIRDRRRRELAIELGDILRVLCPEECFPALCKGLEEHCIAPAMALYEKVQTSPHQYYLDTNPYMALTPTGEIIKSADFIDNLGHLDLCNILRFRKPFDLAKMAGPLPTKEEVQYSLQNVCTVRPALYMQPLGKDGDDDLKELRVVRKQQMLVAYGSDEAKQRFIAQGGRSVFHILWYVSTDRSFGR